MPEVNLTFEVHCHRPPWGIINPNGKFLDSRYRVYVDDNLITERSWLWDNSVFLKENVWITPTKVCEHILKIEPVVYIPEQAVFSVDNFQVANFQANTTKINDLQINFSLR